MTPLLRAAAAAATLSAAGCGGGVADVAGTVKYQGKPVVYGSVVVIGSDGVPKSGTIRPDGTFRVDGVRVGAARVAVSSPRPPGSEPPPAPKPKGGREEAVDKPVPPVDPADPEVIRNWVALPARYGDPDKSELTADVQSGRPLDLDLK
ncbi:MAG: hypothetical protein C0501_11850 [Isosphaera sp.]|nr:hypothetical protein [Isosphaera sp.]